MNRLADATAWLPPGLIVTLFLIAAGIVWIADAVTGTSRSQGD